MIYIYTPFDQESKIEDSSLSPLKNFSSTIIFDPINNCKSAGVIPYTFYEGDLYFLLQCSNSPLKRKDVGWNDFGGKKCSNEETTVEIASREFNEETSCLFYLIEQSDKNDIYQLLKGNINLDYNEQTTSILLNTIPVAQKFFVDRITEYVIPIYISSKEIYVSFFVKVMYIPESDIPNAEDIHINYSERYLRTCKWFSYGEIMEMNEKDFHKRLQITKIQRRIEDYYHKNLF